MSLQIWLPLNSTEVINHGVAGIAVDNENSDFVYEAGGKLYETCKAKSGIKQLYIEQNITSNNFSFSIWHRTNTAKSIVSLPCKINNIDGFLLLSLYDEEINDFFQECEKNPVIGDANMDGDLTAIDMLLLKAAALHPEEQLTPYQLFIGDIDNDKQLVSDEPTKIQDLMLGREEADPIDENKIWHNLTTTAITENGKSTLDFYCDGVIVNSVTYDSELQLRPGYLCLSSVAPMQDLRLYDHTLSPKEVRLISQGMIAHYNFNSVNTNSSIATDCSGFGHHGTFIGASTTTSATLRGEHSLYTPEGYKDYVKIENTYFSADDISLNCWFKSGAAGGKHVIVNVDNLCSLTIDQSGHVVADLVYEDLTHITTTSSSSITNDTWHMLTLVYINEVGVNIYLDSILVAQGLNTNKKKLLKGLKTIFIGGGPSITSDHKETHISDVRIFSAALNINDIQDYYNVSQSLLSNGCVLAYNFNSDKSANFHFTQKGEIKARDFIERSQQPKVSLTEDKILLTSNILEI